MNWKRLLQIAVCLVLVCALLVGVSPIKAEAVVLESVLAGLTYTVCAGLFVWAITTSAGQVFEPPDIKFAQELGEGWEREIYNFDYSSVGGSEDDRDDELEALKKLESLMKASLNKNGKLTKDALADVVLKIPFCALTSFIVDGINRGYFEHEVETPATTGWSYYGDYHLPTLPIHDGFSYMCLGIRNGFFIAQYSTQPMFLKSSNFITSVYECSADYLSIQQSTLSSSSSWGRSFSPSGYDAGAGYGYVDTILWSNHDMFSYSDGTTLVLTGSEPSTTTTTTENIEPISTVGSIVDGIIAGGLTAADIPIPETVDLSAIFEGVETGGLEAVVGNMKSSAAGLASGAISLSDFQQSITYVEDSIGEDSQDPTEDPSPTEGDDSGTEDGDQDIKDGPFSSYSVLDFLSALGDLLQDIADGNFLGVKNFFEPFLSGIRENLSGLSSITESGFQDVIENGQSIIDSMQDVIENNQIQNELNQEIQQEQNNIIEQGFASVSSAVAGGLASAFVPSDGFIEGKVNDLCDEYSFAGSIAATAKDLKSFLTNLGSVPPVIHINLGAATGGYNYGSNMVLIDFSFYEPYKAQMDVILSAFLWLWFCWRVILTLPGIISGASGAVGSFSDASGVGKRGYVELSDSLKGNPVSASHFVPEMDRKHGGRKT